MNKKEIEIILRLRDEVTKSLQGVQSNLHKFSNQVKEMGLDMRKTGREMSFMGTSMLMVGTAITAPLIAAYKEAGKYNAAIAEQLDQTRYVFQNLAISIGTALLPVMKQMTDQVARALDWWNNLDQAMRDRLIQDVFKLGTTLIGLGTAFFVVGKSLSFLGNLALLTSAVMAMNPVILALTIGIGALVFAMIKWQAANQLVCDSLELLGAWVGQVVDYMLMFKNARNFDFAAVKKDWEDINRLSAITQAILSGKGGQTSKFFDDMRSQVIDVMNALNGIGKTNLTPNSEKEGGTLFSGFMMGLTEAKIALGSFRTWGIQAGADLAKGIGDNFKTYFVDLFHGQLKTAQEYFAAFGDMILNIFADVCSKIIEEWIATMIITGLGNIFGSVTSLAAGSYSINGQSLQNTVHTGSIGGTYVGMAEGGSGIARQPTLFLAGEAGPERYNFTPLNKSSQGEKSTGNITINMYPSTVVKAWDFTDVYGHKDEIQAMMAESIDLNKLRKVINANR